MEEEGGSVQGGSGRVVRSWRLQGRRPRDSGVSFSKQGAVGRL